MSDAIVIVGMARTPLGAFNGQFKHCSAVDLGAAAVRGALAGLPLDQVQEISMGCVLPAGTGQAPARQVARLAGLDMSCSASTVNKACGSGLKTLEMGVHSLSYGAGSKTGGAIYVAGGMENMTMAPHLLPQSRQGFRFGDASLEDHIYVDGLQDAGQGKLMGIFADSTAEHYGFLRAEQDAFAIESVGRAKAACSAGAFNSEICPVTVPGHKDATSADEIPSKLDVNKIPRLKPVFNKAGTVTAANASSLADGAAAVALTLESQAKSQGFPILARICDIATHAQAPERFTTAPIPAIRKLLANNDLSVSDIDLWEINEAFAVVPMAAMKELNIDHERLNINGGACALGHPLGATGTRILATLLAAMRKKDVGLGVASLCIGGGEGMAVLLERAEQPLV